MLTPGNGTGDPPKKMTLTGRAFNPQRDNDAADSSRYDEQERFPAKHIV